MLSGSVLESAPLEGDDFQSLLPLLPGVVRGADGRLRIKGGQPSQGALQVSSASLIDPSTGDFDLELPGAERRVGRSPVQSVCRRVRPVLDEHHADADAARHQRLGDQAGQPHAAVPEVVHRHSRVRAALLGSRPADAGSRRSSRRTFSSAISRRRCGACPTSRRSSSRASTRSRGSTPSCRRGTRSAAAWSAFPREVARVTMNTFRPRGGDSGLRAGGLLDRRRRSARRSRRSLVLETTLSVPVVRGRGQHRRAGADGVCAARPRAAATSTIRSATSAASSGSRRSACRATAANGSTCSRSDRPAAIDVHGVQPEPAGGDPAARRIAGRADRFRRADEAGRGGHRVRACSSRIAGAWARE